MAHRELQGRLQLAEQQVQCSRVMLVVAMTNAVCVSLARTPAVLVVTVLARNAVPLQLLTHAPVRVQVSVESRP